MTITVLTPTYNREKELPHLYKSLILQTSFDFEWLIVDDGSEDNTTELIEKYISENKLNIRYIKKINGGKHTALNVGIQNIESKLTFIVDSDDELTEDAIERVLIYHNKYYDVKELCGYSFLRKYTNGNINVSLNNKDDLVLSYYEGRVKNNKIGDMAEVFYTNVLKEYQFPEFPNEKFIGEDIVWLAMSQKYKMVFVNHAIYVSEYLPDGLTKGRRRNNIKSPQGCYHRAKTFLSYQLPLKVLLKNLLQIIIYGKIAKISRKNIFRDSNHFFLSRIMYIPGCVIAKKWLRKYE